MKEFTLLIHKSFRSWLLLILITVPGLVSASSCFDAIDYIKPTSTKHKRALYLMVDQTTPLNARMRQHISELLSSWGKPGDIVKVGAFSANMEGRFPRVAFNRAADVEPGEKFLWQLRWQDKKDLVACMEKQQLDFQHSVKQAISSVMEQANSTIPRTELLYSLKQLSRAMVVKDEAMHQVVVLVSNGMENSPVLSFYKGTKIKKIPTLKTISKIRRQGLIGHWRGADVYIYGLGVIENKKLYINAKQLKDLEAFWERYFVEGGGKVKAVGVPELLISSIE